MSKFTTEVRYICEVESGLTESKGLSSVEEILTKSAPKIFDFDFPIFDENYRLVLEKQILRHYYTREIGEETYGLWKLRLNDRLNLIMPKYNKMYDFYARDFSPYYNRDLTTTHKGSKEGESGQTGIYKKSGSEETDTTTNVKDSGNSTQKDNGTSSQTGSTTNNENNKKYYSDTPQNLTNPNNVTYLTNYTNNQNSDNGTSKNDSTVSNTSTVENESTKDTTRNETLKTAQQTDTQQDTKTSTVDEYIETVKGYVGNLTYGELFIKFKDSLESIDNMIVNELSDLFLNLWE